MKLKSGFLFLVVLFTISACNLTETFSAKLTPTPTIGFTPQPVDTLPPQPTAIPEIWLVTTGEVETVFDWSIDRCADFDIPDLPARAFRDADGNVQLVSTHLDNRRFIGADLNEVKRDCKIVMRSLHDENPSKFNDNTWLASPYTEDGNTIYAIMHNEFHGWEHGEACPGDNFTCWYNALTMGISKDGGMSYQPIAEPPAHLVASLPVQYEAGAGPYGVFEPSNIIKKDAYYYLFVRIDEYKSDEQRICLLRTDKLDKPDSWRAWDGTDFTLQLGDPYLPSDETTRPCRGLDGDLGIMSSSVTYNTDLSLYVMVGMTATFLDGREVWGVLYSFSSDLINWEPRRLLKEVELPWTYQPGDGSVYLYPALLDPESASRNFETTDMTAYLYMTRFNEDFHLNRDLIRIPVQFFFSEEEAESNKIPFTP